MPGSWLNLPQHQAWLAREEARLSAFARAAVDPDGGFGWIGESGVRDPEEPVMTWITGRMTHVFALAHLRGEPGAGALADHGLAALNGPLRDHTHGGWFSGIAKGEPVGGTKSAYEHAFVVIAAASATAAGRPGAAELLTDALEVVDRRFWDESTGSSVESWDRAWTEIEPYRGANSNMHMIEALLAAGDVTNDGAWHRRALRIAERLSHQAAASHGWRLPEHFTPDWEPLPEYNADQKRHQFRPYGTTPGHALEWSRLLLHLETALGADAPEWLVEDAENLFATAVRLGWRADGADGFVYTLDWQDRPVVRERMHWVIAEAILAAAVLYRRTGDMTYEQWYRTWWDYTAQHVIDLRDGSWHHELDDRNEVSATVWAGKPDVYHAYQAVLLPTLPLAASPAGALLK